MNPIKNTYMKMVPYARDGLNQLIREVVVVLKSLTLSSLW